MNGKRRSCAAALALLLIVSTTGVAQTLRGSPGSVDRMYRQARSQDLRFAESASAIRNAYQDGGLMRLEGNANYTLHDVSYPYVVPSTHVFVARLASQYRAACGEPMVVTSAIRPTSMRLRNGVSNSVHPTGMAVDLRKPRSSRCLRWLRSTLLSLEAGGVLDAVEERNPPHFHVAVFPSQYRQYVSRRTDGQVQVATAPSPSRMSSGGGEAGAYRVRRGDSLWEIARQNEVSVAALRAENNLLGSEIEAGQSLRIPGDAEPAPTPTPLLATTAASPSASSEAPPDRTYRVRPGDSLWEIARRNGVTVASLQAANGVSGPRIRAGQTLRIPGNAQVASDAGGGGEARTYQVRRGDSLWTIARQNDVSVDRLQEANDLRGSRILPGQILEIPAR